MPKKITTKQDQKIEAAARAQFATDVISLYNATIAGRRAPRHPDPDVRTVAFGLVALKQAVELASRKHRNNREALIASGAPVADEIITALTTTARRDHPLWKHIGSLQTSPHRATAGRQQRWEMLAGVALAYQEASDGSLRGATRAVCEGIPATDYPVNPEKLRKWVDRNEKAARVHANQFLADAKALGGPAAALPRCVIIAGRNAMGALLVVPS
jgi:hypothetical protein